MFPSASEPGQTTLEPRHPEKEMPAWDKDRPRRSSLLGEYLYFLRHYKMWWLVPTVALLLGLGFLVVLGGSQAALLIYALF